MKWIFILLLLTNVVYLGWEIDRDTGLKRTNIAAAVKVPAGTPRLELLTELNKLPEKRVMIKLDENISADAFNSEPVLPIDLNPNTKNMIDTLLTAGPEAMLQTVEPSRTSMFDSSTDTANALNRPEKIVCYTYGPIPDKKESSLFSDWLTERDIKHMQRQTNEKGKQLFWVYLAPQASRAEAEAALNDLKQKGVRDLRLIREGDLLNAISLGLFSSQAAVNRRLNEIKTKGYAAVAVPYSGEKSLHWFDVSVVLNSDYINELFTGLPARFNALPVNCNEIAMQ